MQIKDNTFLITGAGSGLGAAVARMIVTAGGKAIIADVDTRNGIGTARQLGANALFVETNVTDETSVTACIRTSTDHFGPIRAAINCAGIGLAERVVGKNGPHVLDNFRRVVEINLIGSFNVVRLVADAMSTLAPLPSGERGLIVNTSSAASTEGQVGQAAYSASKGGINAMTLPIARELSKFGIRVMTIAPGIFDTPMMRGMNQEVRDSLAQQVPFPARFGKPEEFAALVRHIIENEYLNGEIIRLDAAVRMGAR